MEKGQFEDRIEEIKRGKEIIEKVAAGRGGRRMTLIYPDREEDVVPISIRYLPSLFKRYDSITVLCCDGRSGAEIGVAGGCETVMLERDEMEAVLRYAQVVERETLRIISFVTPGHLDARDLIGTGGITRQSYLYRALFGNFAGAMDDE